MHFMKETCLHNLESLETLVDTNTKLVALGAAANSCGSLTDIKSAVSIIKNVSGGGALVYVDAVHLAPHQLIDVRELGCDFLVCSAYKFCGPHYGALYGLASVLERLFSLLGHTALMCKSDGSHYGDQGLLQKVSWSDCGKFLFSNELVTGQEGSGNSRVCDGLSQQHNSRGVH